MLHFLQNFFWGGDEGLVYKDRIVIEPELDMYELTGDYAGYYLVPTPLLDNLFDKKTLIRVYVNATVTKIFEAYLSVSLNIWATNTHRYNDESNYKEGVILGGKTDLRGIVIDESKRLAIQQSFYLCSQDYFDKQVVAGNVSSTPSDKTLVYVEFRDKVIWYK